MKNKIYNIISLSLLTILLASCWSYGTTSSYSEDFKHGHSTSKPIYLSIKETSKDSFYFLLSKKINSDDFFLHVRWVSKTKAKQFNGPNSSLKFLIDNIELISLNPVKPIRTVAFLIDPSGIEEEGVYKLSREELTKMAFAKSITVDLQGKYVNKIAQFNKIHTFKAFKDFLKNG